MDYEELLEEAINKINSSQTDMWSGAEAIHRLFAEHGRFEAEFMAIISEQTHRGPDTLYHYRKAWQVRKLLDGYNPLFSHVLPISFYYCAYDFLDRLEIDDIAFWMESAASERKSIRWFGAQLSSVAGNELNADRFTRNASGAIKKIVNLRQDAELLGMPEKSVKQLGWAARLVERAMEA